MKKILVLLFLFFSLTMIFGNEVKTGLIFAESSSSKKITKMSMDNYIPKVPSSIAMTVFGGILTTGGVTTFGIATWFFIKFDGLNSFLTGLSTSLIGSFGQVMMLSGVMMLCGGIIRLLTLRKTIYGSPYWKHQMNSLKKILGIVSLTSSIVPLAGLICTIYSTCITKFFLFLLVPGILTIPLFIAQVAVGIGLIASWFKNRLLTTEVSLVHDSKKDYTEGYSVIMGLKVRI